MNASLRVLRLVLLAGAVSLSLRAEPGIPAPEDPWQTRLPAFSAEGPVRGEAPILLYFTAPWCGFCKQVERGALADPEVRGQVSRLRAHKIDFDAQRGLVERFGVRGIPAFVLTNDRGEVIDRLTGASEKEAFLVWLKSGQTEALRRAIGAEERARELAALVAGIEGASGEARRHILARLWERAGRGDETEKRVASETLAGVAADAAAAKALREDLWRTGLGHADLAVRVAAANFLRSAEPEKGRLYDPWAEEAARAEAIRRLVGER